MDVIDVHDFGNGCVRRSFFAAYVSCLLYQSSVMPILRNLARSDGSISDELPFARLPRLARPLKEKTDGLQSAQPSFARCRLSKVLSALQWPKSPEVRMPVFLH